MGQLYNLDISDLNHRGEGVGKVSGFAVFVAGALPGETVEACITRVHKNYAEAELLALKTAGAHRRGRSESFPAP